MIGVRVGRHPLTDNILVQGYVLITDKDVCSFCDNDAQWQVGNGAVLYCSPCRIAEHSENHAFWHDMSLVDIEIVNDDAGIHTEIVGWRS